MTHETDSSPQPWPHTYESLSVDAVAEHIYRITLTGPGKNNAMGAAMWREIPEAIEHLRDADDVRAIILTGSNEVFTSGLDFMDLDPALAPIAAGEPLGADTRTQLLRIIERMQKAGNALAQCPIPVIAAVDQHCIGGGIDLLAACDIRLCTDRARFSVREVRVGIVADMGTLARLPHIVGDGRVRDWALTGRTFGADEALSAGLVAKVTTPEDLQSEAEAYAARIAGNPPLVVQGVKQVLNVNTAESVAAANRYVGVWNAAFMPSQDMLQAVMATMMGQKPKFEGK